MKKFSFITVLTAWAFCVSAIFAADNQAPEGFVSLFDGKTLTNWEGDPTFWSVQDGCITGVSTPEKKIPYSMHIAWTGEPVGDFELLIDFKLINGNSGIMYRAAKDARRKWGLMGYQADIDSRNSYTGIMYGEEIGGILTGRGQKCKIGTDRKAVLLEQFASSDELAKKINFEDWNTYRIVVKGNVMTHYINGVLMSETIEEDPSMLKTGTFGMQIHPGPPMTVQFKNIYLKKL